MIRTLLAGERGLYAAHLKRLGPQDRCRRFSRARVPDEWIDAYVQGIPAADLILGAFGADGLVGGAHVGLVGGTAEVAVSVEEGSRGTGLGSELFLRAAIWARNRRAVRLYALCAGDNLAMVSLARRLGMRIRRDSGEAEAFLDLPPPDLFTVTDELAAGLQGMVRDWFGMVEAWRRRLRPQS